MQTVYEAAGGIDGLRRLADAWHRRVMAEDIGQSLVEAGDRAAIHFAAYWAEALGGPTTYSDSNGDETTVVKMHSGNGEHDERTLLAEKEVRESGGSPYTLSPSPDQCGMLRPFGTSSADWW